MGKFLIVGLGNIGTQYQNTRHNIGFMVADALAEQLKTTFTTDRHAFVAQGKFASHPITLIKPTTYMNLSGKAVRYWIENLKLKAEQILVIVDDLAFDFGTLRIKPKGSDAGHNGLKDIAANLGTDQYPRLRFGIGQNFPKGKQADYVLSDFTAQERSHLPELIEKSVQICLSFIQRGINPTMNDFNK